MANISYNRLNLYAPNTPEATVIPYWNNLTNSLGNTNMYFDIDNESISIGSIAQFYNADQAVYLGLASTTTSYLQLLPSNVLAIGAGVIRLDNMTLAVTAGGASGKHLPIVIGGTLYKIALVNP